MENMERGNHQRNHNFQVLVDSDAFIGRVYPNDVHYKRASEIFRSLKEHHVSLVTTSLVVAETATVLSHRKGQSLARIFLEEVIKTGGFPVIHITEDLQEEALTIFLNQTKKGNSVTDCANVAVIVLVNNMVQ
jgi:predicted nucleic acid-binding protein